MGGDSEWPSKNTLNQITYIVTAFSQDFLIWSSDLVGATVMGMVSG